MAAAEVAIVGINAQAKGGRIGLNQILTSVCDGDWPASNRHLPPMAAIAITEFSGATQCAPGLVIIDHHLRPEGDERPRTVLARTAHVAVFSAWQLLAYRATDNGRALAVRLRDGSLVFWLIVAYLPTATNKYKRGPQFSQTCEQLTDLIRWVKAKGEAAIGFMDTNTHFPAGPLLPPGKWAAQYPYKQQVRQRNYSTQNRALALTLEATGCHLNTLERLKKPPPAAAHRLRTYAQGRSARIVSSFLDHTVQVSAKLDLQWTRLRDDLSCISPDHWALECCFALPGRARPPPAIRTTVDPLHPRRRDHGIDSLREQRKMARGNPKAEQELISNYFKEQARLNYEELIERVAHVSRRAEIGDLRPLYQLTKPPTARHSRPNADQLKERHDSLLQQAQEQLFNNSFVGLPQPMQLLERMTQSIDNQDRVRCIIDGSFFPAEGSVGLCVRIQDPETGLFTELRQNVNLHAFGWAAPNSFTSEQAAALCALEICRVAYPSHRPEVFLDCRSVMTAARNAPKQSQSDFAGSSNPAVQRAIFRLATTPNPETGLIDEPIFTWVPAHHDTVQQFEEALKLSGQSRQLSDIWEQNDACDIGAKAAAMMSPAGSRTLEGVLEEHIHDIRDLQTIVRDSENSSTIPRPPRTNRSPKQKDLKLRELVSELRAGAATGVSSTNKHTLLASLNNGGKSAWRAVLRFLLALETEGDTAASVQRLSGIPKDEAYRLIGCLDCEVKLWELLLLSDIYTQFEPDYHGFITGRGTLAPTTILQDAHRETFWTAPPGTKRFSIFFDFRTAFPSIPKEQIFIALEALGASAEQLRAYRAIYEAPITLDGEHIGRQQLGGITGDGVTPIIFNSIMSHIWKRVQDDIGTPAGVLRLIFADDGLLSCTDLKTLTMVAQKFVDVAATVNLHLNINKTKAMLIEPAEDRPLNTEDYSARMRTGDQAAHFINLWKDPGTKTAFSNNVLIIPKSTSNRRLRCPFEDCPWAAISGANTSKQCHQLCNHLVLDHQDPQRTAWLGRMTSRNLRRSDLRPKMFRPTKEETNNDRVKWKTDDNEDSFAMARNDLALVLTINGVKCQVQFTVQFKYLGTILANNTSMIPHIRDRTFQMMHLAERAHTNLLAAELNPRRPLARLLLPVILNSTLLFGMATFVPTTEEANEFRKAYERGLRTILGEQRQWRESATTGERILACRSIDSICSELHCLLPREALTDARLRLAGTVMRDRHLWKWVAQRWAMPAPNRPSWQEQIARDLTQQELGWGPNNEWFSNASLTAHMQCRNHWKRILLHTYKFAKCGRAARKREEDIQLDEEAAALLHDAGLEHWQEEMDDGDRDDETISVLNDLWSWNLQ